MNNIQLSPIGQIVNQSGIVQVVLAPRYAAGLKGLSGFGHVQILWWMNACDTPSARATLREAKPYTHGPAELGVFALRSPERPNPVAATTAAIAFVDEAEGIIGLHWIDAFDGSPVLDLKPYTPSLDRVERPATPAWCAHWPRSCEESATFDWAAEFNF